MMALTPGMKRINSAMGWPMNYCLLTGRQFKAGRSARRSRKGVGVGQTS
jgi:hypothetical protein